MLKGLIKRLGAPGRARTCDLLIRSQTLYPTELRVHGKDGKGRGGNRQVLTSDICAWSFVLGQGQYHLAVAGGSLLLLASITVSALQTHPLPRGGTDPIQVASTKNKRSLVLEVLPHKSHH